MAWKARMVAIMFGAVAASVPASVFAADRSCDAATPCRVADGTYLAVPPPGWDGRSPVSATIFFHGYGGSAANVVADTRFVDAFAREGVLLIVPDGANRTWSHVGSPSQARDELAFMDAVMADAAERWPIDRHRTLVTGFSQGGSMVWDLACYRGNDYGAFAPVAGGFWQPLPAACPSGPVLLHHIHGTADTVVPMTGRAIREVYRQGDILAGISLWRTHNECANAAVRTSADGGLQCTVWSGCSAGGEVRLCLHPGGHVFPVEWIAGIQDWARSVMNDR